MRPPRSLLLLPLAGLLGGCSAVVMSPSGDVAMQQRNLILASTGLMLLIVLPVLAATLVFAWHFRASNTKASYEPNWHHSTQLEVLIWTAPLLIIIVLGALTWIYAHTLDPFRPIARLGADRPVAPGTKPLRVDVVALDWKWLFFYPDQGIATVNELAAPVDMPIDFHLTSATVMNTFFVPALAGQIYAMAGMETRLGAVINHEGVYAGYSGNYSGAGYSHMTFKFHGLSQPNFDGWVAKVKADAKPLDAAAYDQLAKPSEAEPVHYFTMADTALFGKIANMCVQPGKMCMGEMMTIDAKGGQGGAAGEANRARLLYDGARVGEGNEAPGATFPASGRPPNTGNHQPQGMKPRAVAPDVNAQKPGGTQGGDMPGMPGMTEPGPAPTQLNDRSRAP